jgi:hypothetical protein
MSLSPCHVYFCTFIFVYTRHESSVNSGSTAFNDAVQPGTEVPVTDGIVCNDLSKPGMPGEVWSTINQP